MSTLTDWLKFVRLPTPIFMQVETFALTVASGIICHVLFNRLEPRGVVPCLRLLLAPPTIVTYIATFGSTTLTLLEATTNYLLILAIYLGSLTTSVVVYRLSPLHPLASYPGPILCKISRLWIGYITSTGRQHIYYTQLHERYGPYVRTGPNNLNIDDIAVLPDVMATRPFQRGERYETNRIKGSKGAVIGIIDPEEHAQRRKIWDRGLNISAVHGYTDALSKQVHQLLEVLEIREGIPFDLSGWLSCLSFDFMGDLAFGGAFHLLDTGKDKNASPPKTLDIPARRAVTGNIPWLFSFFELVGANGSIHRLENFALQSVVARKEKGSNRKDLFYYLLDEAGLGTEPPSLPTLINEATLAIIAGSDTTGTSLSNLFFFLLTNPDVYAKLQAEVDREFPKGADVFAASSSSVTRSMQYLNAVINETLRLRPAVPSGINRRLPKGTGGVMLGDKYIPEGTTVQIAAYSVHHNPKYFAPSPEKFYPERWIDSETPGHILDHSAFFPFSYGPTNCAGKSLAIFEMRAVVCSLLQKFEYEFAPGYNPLEWEKHLRDHNIYVKGQLPVMIKARW
ncbi:hypothetical protein M422DRAFT_778700 [Sphaerobolus stellatus SS14]|uniref:Unplaced genomic scaffold SPHSTscaffold_35, whole genome shotgun sequence n=1 Tax=Sphaerobolus stellatus (strain SS14) TaxID=990650 RepID=A0A0C9VG54_SPHS4|nr:hypothetical protein M422DRAFT_778700 [Sphaerobolus stellatus SS14]